MSSRRLKQSNQRVVSLGKDVVINRVRIAPGHKERHDGNTTEALLRALQWQQQRPKPLPLLLHLQNEDVIDGMMRTLHVESVAADAAAGRRWGVIAVFVVIVVASVIAIVGVVVTVIGDVRSSLASSRGVSSMIARQQKNQKWARKLDAHGRGILLHEELTVAVVVG